MPKYLGGLSHNKVKIWRALDNFVKGATGYGINIELMENVEQEHGNEARI